MNSPINDHYASNMARNRGGVTEMQCCLFARVALMVLITLIVLN